MPSKYRILFAIGTMGGGGAERQVLGLLKHLNRERFEPMLYLASFTGELLAEIPEDVTVFAYDQRHPQFPRINWPGRMHKRRVADMATVIAEQHIDLVYDRTYHMTLISGPATHQTKTKRISVVANDPEQDLINYEIRFRKIKQRMLKKSYQSANVVLTVSEGVRQNMLNYYNLNESLVRTIYSPVDIDRIDRLCNAASAAVSEKNVSEKNVSEKNVSERKVSERKVSEKKVSEKKVSEKKVSEKKVSEKKVSEKKFTPSKFHVVSSGRLHPQKGYQFLIEAAHELVNIRKYDQLQFHILGEGDLREELTSSIQQRELQETVFLEGFQENPFALLQQAELFCLPSLFEGLPNALLEAMACHIPVLSTDCPSGPREILKEGKYGRLIPPGNATALADGIEDALLNHDQWKAIVPAAREHIEEEFGLKRGMQKLEELFLELCDQ